MKWCQWPKVFFLGFFLLPLIFNPGAEIPYEVPRVIFFLIWVKLLAVLGIFCLKTLKAKKFEKGILISAVVYLLVATLLSLKGVDIPKSFIGNLYRQDGLIIYYHLLGFSILVSWFWRKEFKSILTGIIFIQVALISLAVVYYFFKLKGLGGQFIPPFGNVNFLAGFLVCSLPFFFYSLLNFNLAKIWKIIFYILPVLAILLTVSAGAISVMVVYLGFEASRKITKKYRLFFWLSGFAIALAIVGFWFKSLKKEKYLNPQGRDRIYHKVFVGALKRPLLGWGWANIDYAFESNDWPIRIDHDVYVDKAHNLFLEVFTSSGTVGLGIFLVLIFLILRKRISIYRKRKDDWNYALLATFVVYLLHAQTNVISVSEEIYFWLILGLSL